MTVDDGYLIRYTLTVTDPAGRRVMQWGLPLPPPEREIAAVAPIIAMAWPHPGMLTPREVLRISAHHTRGIRMISCSRLP